MWLHTILIQYFKFLKVLWLTSSVCIIAMYKTHKIDNSIRSSSSSMYKAPHTQGYNVLPSTPVTSGSSLMACVIWTRLILSIVCVSRLTVQEGGRLQFIIIIILQGNSSVSILSPNGSSTRHATC